MELSDTNRDEACELRLAALETKCRMQGRWITVLISAIVVLSSVGWVQAGPTKFVDIVAQSVTITDEKGREVIYLGLAEDDRPLISLSTENGKEEDLLQISTDAEGGSLSIYSRQPSKANAALTIEPEGASLALSASKGEGSVYLLTTSSGGAASFLDGRGEAGSSVGALSGLAGVVFEGSKGEDDSPTMLAEVKKDSSRLVFKDAEGNEKTLP